MRGLIILLVGSVVVADVGRTGADQTICLFLEHERSGLVIILDPSSGAIRWRHERPQRPVLHVQGSLPTSDLRPRVTRERVYVVDSGTGTLVALDRRTGRMLWEKKLPYRSPNVFLECDGESVVVSAYGEPPAKMFDREGNEVWEAAVAGQPVFGGDRVYVARVHGPNRLYALDRKTGAQDWEHHHGGWPVGWDGERFYFASSGGIAAFSVRDQKEHWRVPGVAYFGAVADGRLYVHRNGTEILGVDLKDGKEVGTVPLAGGSRYTQVLAGGGVIVAMDRPMGSVTVLSFEDKKLLAQYETGVRMADLHSLAAVIGQIAVVANPKERRVESTVWRCDVPEGPAGLAGAVKRVVVASGKMLLGLDASSGRVIWRRELPVAVTRLAAGVFRP